MYRRHSKREECLFANARDTPIARAFAERYLGQVSPSRSKCLHQFGDQRRIGNDHVGDGRPGDEVIIFDPFFVMYPPLVQLVGGVPVYVDTYPDFRIDLDKVERAITPRTKLILFNSPGNPTGVTATLEEVKGLADLAAKHGVALVSDEIYSGFSFDEPMRSPAEFNPETIVIDGFSKSHAMTGWRLGYVHGPNELIQTMIKLQQYTFVCAPQPVQWAGLAAMDYDMTQHYQDYAQKRDIIVNGLEGYYRFTKPGGAFYIFPRFPAVRALTL